MSLRLDLYQWMQRYRLDGESKARLYALAAFDREPDELVPVFIRGIAIAAAASAGLGLVFWVAANWESFGRIGRSFLLQALLLTCGVGAWRFVRARTSLICLMVLTVGGLLAVFGQTYQTGADPWQLFALWTVLVLPLGLAARSDAVWTLWAVVAHTAILLWVTTWLGDDFEVWPLGHVFASWAVSATVVLGLAAPLRSATGAGLFASRLALTLGAIPPIVHGIVAVFEDKLPGVYPAALLLCMLAGLLYSRPGRSDLYAVSLSVLALDVLLLSGLGHWLFEGSHDWIMAVLLLGICAALLLAAEVSLALRLHRREKELAHA